MLPHSLLLLCPLFSPGDGEPLFLEESQSRLAGVETICGSDEKDYIMEVNGAGLALADFNGDGAVDILIVDGSTIAAVDAEQAGRPPRLFLNDGNGVFELAGEDWAMAGGVWGNGCATGDLNGDGWIDLVITEWGRDRVLLNKAGAGFEEVTERSGMRKGSRWSTSAALFDSDGDGVLDLTVACYLSFNRDEISKRGEGGKWKGHHVMSGPEGCIPVHDQLYKGKGDGTFRVVPSMKSGFEPEKARFALGMQPLDYDVDGDVDLYVANDSEPNHLWENQGDGTFIERALRYGVDMDGNGKEQAGMGITTGDVNRDGRPDIFVTNFSGESNALYLSRRRGWKESSASQGLGGPSQTKLGWGTGMGDFDLDGDLDLFVLNGHVYPQADNAGTDTSYAQEDQLYRQGSNGKFRDELLSTEGPTVSRAGACADLDGDGDLDIVALTMNGPVRVLMNQTIRGADEDQDRSDTHWLRVQLRGRGANTMGVGARVEARWSVKNEAGELQAVTQVEQLFTSGGYQAATPPEVHFGLGEAATLKELVVSWPSGQKQTLTEVASDQVLVVSEPEPTEETQSEEAK